MSKIWKSTKIRLLAVGILVATLVMSFSPINFYINPTMPQSQSKSLSVGNQRLVLTIGNVAHATGTLDYAWNGVNDNVNINAALSLLASHGGGELVVMTENYTCIAPINVPANVTIRGLGDSTSITFSGAAITNGFIITGDNSTLENLKVIIAAGAGVGGARPNNIYGSGKSNITVKDCILVGDNSVGDDGTSSRQDGVYLTFGNNNKVIHNTIYNYNRHGIYIASVGGNSLYASIEDNYVYNTFYHNIALGAQSSVVRGNHTTGNTGSSGYLLIGGGYNTFNSNTSNGDANGIEVNSGSTLNIIANNTFQGNTGFAITANAAGASNRFIGNEISNPGFGAVSDSSGTQFYMHNTGYITENSGIFSITANIWGVSVNHGLSTNATSVQITLTSNATAQTYILAPITTTAFSVNLTALQGSAITGYWRAVVGAGN